MSKTVDMTGGNPTKHILTFALPLIVTNIGQQLYMIADAAIVGRGVGVQALAAVGATDWCYWLVMGIAKWSLVSGIAELIARIGMSKAVIHIIGSDALFLSEPVAWLGALLSVLLPYLWYQRTVLRATNITVA